MINDSCNSSNSSHSRNNSIKNRNQIPAEGPRAASGNPFSPVASVVIVKVSPPHMLFFV